MSAPDTPHPKRVLYERVYAPLTASWFAALDRSPTRQWLLKEAGHRDLVDTLTRFDSLFHQLVPESLECLGAKAVDLLNTVNDLRDHVIWLEERPGPNPTVSEMRESLIAKLQRNVSLGTVEALLCLESARVFARDELGLTGSALMETLVRSKQLYVSLAALHDDQERQRLAFLTGQVTGFYYPQVHYRDVVNGKLAIKSDKFLAAGSVGAPRVRFVSHIVSRPTASPTMRCPAQWPADHATDGSLNGELWRLLIDIYQRSGRFAAEG